MKFTHPELDGRWNRLLGASIIESRDPNDGQSADPTEKNRHQYTLVNGILLKRVLPPESVGDRWRDVETGRLSRRPPEWQSIDVPDWPLLTDWYTHVWGDAPSPWSMGGSAAYGARDNGVTMLWMKSRIQIAGTDWPQQVACPHCLDWIVWAEACYVPGYRICRGCHRHWRISSGRKAGWTMCPNGRRGWPYAEVQR